MFSVVYIIHILICFAIIGLVLIQQGKGAEAGAIFGSSSDSVVGAGSAPNFMGKVTTSMAIAFMITSVILVKTYISAGEVVVDQSPVAEVGDLPVSASENANEEVAVESEEVAPVAGAEETVTETETVAEGVAVESEVVVDDAKVEEEAKPVAP